MLKKIFMALFILAFIACAAEPRVVTDVEGSANLKPDPSQSLVSRELVKIIEGAHYKKVKVDDSLSSKILDKYINQRHWNLSWILIHNNIYAYIHTSVIIIFVIIIIVFVLDVYMLVLFIIIIISAMHAITLNIYDNNFLILLVLTYVPQYIFLIIIIVNKIVTILL